VVKTIKTFLATWRPAGGVIRVVLVQEEDDWLPYFSTNVDRSVSPWDSAPRRPSHQDKRKAWQRAVLQGEIAEALSGRPTKQNMRQLAERLRALAA
jgi:hypothetical protein